MPDGGLPGQVKTCKTCQLELPLDRFYKDGKGRGGLRASCKSCVDVVTKAYRENRPGWYRDTQLKGKYGISSDDYDRMSEEQGHVCKVCGKAETRTNSVNLCVDHCHVTGKVRGLICHKCNTAMGCVSDSPELLAKLIDYLKESTYGCKEG